MAMIVYRQFVDNANLYEKTVSAYRFFEYTEGLRAEKAIQYCAEKTELNRTDVGVSRLAAGYERFMIDCIILAADEYARRDNSRLGIASPIHVQNTLIGSGRPARSASKHCSKILAAVWRFGNRSAACASRHDQSMHRRCFWR